MSKLIDCWMINYKYRYKYGKWVYDEDLTKANPAEWLFQARNTDANYDYHIISAIPLVISETRFHELQDTDFQGYKLNDE